MNPQNSVEADHLLTEHIEDVQNQHPNPELYLYSIKLKTKDQHNCLLQIEAQDESQQESNLEYQDAYINTYEINELKYTSLNSIKQFVSDPHSILAKYFLSADILIQFIQIFVGDFQEKIENLIMHNKKDDKMFQYLTHIQNKKKKQIQQHKMLKYQITKSNIKFQRINDRKFIDNKILNE